MTRLCRLIERTRQADGLRDHPFGSPAPEIRLTDRRDIALLMPNSLSGLRSRPIAEFHHDRIRVKDRGLVSGSSRWRIAIALLVVSHALPATAERVLRARLNSDIASVDPGMKRDENTDAVLLHLVEGLVASREDGSVAPLLASSWSIAPDGRSYKFTLRRGVRFHNGAPLTSAEVVWSLKRYFGPASHWRCKVDFGSHGFAEISSIVANDRFTVTINLVRAAPMFLREMARADCGGTGILHPASLGPDGQMRAPIGTGPFRLALWRRSQFVDLTRFKDYQSRPGPRDGNAGGKHALVDRIRFEVIPDGSAASAALLRHSLDVLDNLATNELGALKGVSGIRIDVAPVMDFYGILFQTRDPVLADPRIRRAIAQSLDVAALTRVATHGTATANSSPVPAGSPYHGIVQRPLIQQDLAASRALVRAARYRGQTIQLITNRRYPQAFDSAIIVQAMARAVGLNIEIVTLDWATQLARYAQGNYQAMIFGYSARLDPALSLEPLIGEKAVDPRKVWDDPAARALLAQATSTADIKARQRAFDGLERLFRQTQPAVILFNTSRIAAVRTNVTGYRSWPAGTQRLWDVELR